MNASVKPPMVSVAGFSNSGKTTLISRLIALFAARGLKVAAIKHARHGFHMDHPGKDTQKHRQAGAYGVLVAAQGQIAVIRDVPEEPSPVELAALYFPDADLVFVEGYKSARIPRMVIALCPEDFQAFENDTDVMALVGCPPSPTPLPVFDRDDVSAIANFLQKHLLDPPDR
ncbi:MAG: molybdopterin-guanine dinucleotide biosynthesis protein B [Deltaproteobacteria bacterium]|nr:molybdopterin-guanine dinucleotide biosynthesis protein B [Deltaproteobacteria bacterium]